MLSWAGNLLSAGRGTCASGSQLRAWLAWPGGGGGGAAYETGSVHFIVFPSRPLALFRVWLGGDGERAYGQKSCIPAPLAADFGPMMAWLEGLLRRLALADPAGDLKNALLRRRLGCYVSDCACRLTLGEEEEETNMERSGPTPPAFRRPAGPAGAADEEHLLLLRIATAAGEAAGLLLDICTCWFVSV